jgi:hypothetical protein
MSSDSKLTVEIQNNTKICALSVVVNPNPIKE